MDRAVNECIQENILKEFLMKNKAEVIAVSIFEYNLNITKKRKKRSYGKRNSIMDWSREYEEECSKECNKVWNVEILLRVIKQTLKKIQKGCTAEETADMLEVD